MMPTITLAPSTINPGGQVNVTGGGFTPKKKIQLATDGSGWTANVFRVKPDGTFSVGLPGSPTTVGEHTVAARYNGTTTIVATAKLTVVAVIGPEPPPPVPSGDLQALINATPNGGTLDLTGGVFTSPVAIQITNRIGLVIKGGKVTVTTKSEGFRISRGSGITLRGIELAGTTSHPGAYSAGDEWWHAVGLYGTVDCNLEGLRIHDWDGDGVYVANDGTLPTQYLDILDTTIERVGRMGVAVVHGRDIIGQRLAFRDIGFRPIDLEPDWNTYPQECVRVAFDGGTVRGWVRKDAATGTVYGTTWAYVGTPGVTASVAPIIDSVRIAGYDVDVTSPTAPHWWMEVSPGGYRVRSVAFEGNHTPNQVYGVTATRTDGFTFRNNAAPHNGPWPATNDCTSVVTA